MAKTRLQLTWFNKDKALIPTENGKYGYAWVEPSDPRYCETHTLIFDEYVQGTQAPKRDDYEYSERADLTPQEDNLLIRGESGDVLETLTRVPELANKYVGKVKLIYIDPPFNTEQTFPSYEDNLEHSIWLTMMRDRLLHLKRLLSNDGSIWVHLDDGEVHRMRLLLDEVFGPTNFIAEVSWEKTFKPRNDAKMFSSRHDVILCYRRAESFKLNKLPRTDEMNSSYKNLDNDPKGKWTSAPATATGSTDHQGMVYGIQHPITGKILYPADGQHWRNGQMEMLNIMRGWNKGYELQEIDDIETRANLCNVAIDEVREIVPALIIPSFSSEEAKNVYERGQWPLVYITSNGLGGFRKKTYLCDMEGRAVEDVWFQDEVGSNDEAKNEIKALFHGETPFSTPKPERLLERIIHIGTNPGDIVLDCFAGSGTTAAVAQKMGRRWVTCELLQDTFNKYTLPRLTKVVNGEDSGGITCVKGVRIPAEDVELPEGIDAEDAATFTKLLNKIVRESEQLNERIDSLEEKEEEFKRKQFDKTIKLLKEATKTKNGKDIINWRGGGGFQIAHLSPECFDYDPKHDRVLLTNEAKGETLICSIAANLGFALIEDAASVFDAKRGDNYLKVIDGIATIEIVDWLLSQIDAGKTITIAALSVMDGVREYLRRNCKGSRIIAIPDDIFRFQKGGEE